MAYLGFHKGGLSNPPLPAPPPLPRPPHSHPRPVARIVKTRRQTGRAPPPLHFPPLPLEVGPLNPARGSWGSAVSSPSRVWGAPAEIDFGAF